MKGPGFASVLAIASIWLSAGPAGAQGLDIRGWLERPGVKLLAVELYASWCKPCIEAVPRWAALHDKYRNQGLRLVVVAVRDPEGGCANPGWFPDEVICDEEGVVSDALGAGSLPSAFLWAWDGTRLVRAGHVDEVEQAIAAWLPKAPRVLVRAPTEELRALVRSEISRLGKLEVVATEEERATLAKLQRDSYSSRFDERTACEVGKQLPANALLEARLTGRSRKKLHLSLFSVETGCLVASARVDYDGDQPSVAAAEASTELIQTLRRQASVARPAVKPVARVRPARRGQRTVVRMKSNPPGAMVLLDGKPLCQTDKTGCAREVELGVHDFSMLKEGYLPLHERIEVKKGLELDWSLDPDFGWLNVSSTPPGLRVSVSGRALGVTPLENHRLASGTHELQVTGRCHQEIRKPVVIERGQPTRIEVTADAQRASIDVSAADSRGNAVAAEVFVDGQRVGETPGMFDVPACAEQLQVRAEGQGSASEQLRLRGGEAKRIQVVLQPSRGLEPIPSSSEASLSTDKDDKGGGLPNWVWFIVGGAALATGGVLDGTLETSSNGELDGEDFIPVGLYGAGLTFVILGFTQ